MKRRRGERGAATGSASGGCAPGTVDAVRQGFELLERRFDASRRHKPGAPAATIRFLDGASEIPSSTPMWRAMLPTLRQLQYLKLLAEHRSFSRAAEAAHVTQPTLSAGVQELEKHPRRAGGRPRPRRRHPHRRRRGGRGARRDDPGAGRGPGAGGPRRRPAARRPLPAGRDPDHRPVPAAAGAAGAAPALPEAAALPARGPDRPADRRAEVRRARRGADCPALRHDRARLRRGGGGRAAGRLPGQPPAHRRGAASRRSGWRTRT